MNITIEEINQKISELAHNHESSESLLGNDRDEEYFEAAAFDMITEYCEYKGYDVNGFPNKKKKKLADSDPDLDEDYFCIDRYRYYVDTLTLEKEDVANLNWHYYSSFWPTQFNDKNDFMESVKSWVKSGKNFYGVEL